MYRHMIYKVWSSSDTYCMTSTMHNDVCLSLRGFGQLVGSLWQMSYLTNLSLYTFRSMYRYIIYKVWSSLDTYFIISTMHHQHLHSLPIIGKFLSTCSFLEGGNFVTDEIYGREIAHLNALDEIQTNMKRSCYDC